MKTLTTCLISITLSAFFSCNSNNAQKVEETKKTTAQSGTSANANNIDTVKKTTIALSPAGASLQTKSGAQVKVNKQSASVGTKDVKISVIPGKY